MTVNAYLPPGWQNDHELHTTRQEKDKGATHVIHEYGGMRVYDVGPMAFVMLTAIGGPAEGIEFVRFTLRDSFYGPIRACGLYRRGTAEARLEKRDSGTGQGLLHVVNISASTYKEMSDMRDAIRAGTIRPEIDWEGPQIAREPSEIEQRVARLESHSAAFDERTLLRCADSIVNQVEEIIVSHSPPALCAAVIQRSRRSIARHWNRLTAFMR